MLIKSIVSLMLCILHAFQTGSFLSSKKQQSSRCGISAKTNRQARQIDSCSLTLSPGKGEARLVRLSCPCEEMPVSVLLRDRETHRAPVHTPTCLTRHYLVTINSHLWLPPDDWYNDNITEAFPSSFCITSLDMQSLSL